MRLENRIMLRHKETRFFGGRLADSSGGRLSIYDG
jgi:hypothetical protein